MLNRKSVALSAILVLVGASILVAVTPVVITSTYITYSTNTLTVYGSGFATGAAPTFIFNGKTLTVKGYTNVSVAAVMPSTTNQGTYQVTIRNSQGASATTTTFWDGDGLGGEYTDSTLKGTGLQSSPLGINVPLTLISDSTSATLTLTNGNLNEDTPALLINSGIVEVSNVGGDGGHFDAIHGQYGVASSGSIGVYGGACCTDEAEYGVVGDGGGDAPPDGNGGIGVYGTSGTGPNYAGYFEGNVEVTGNLSKAGGSFKIDHPLDPANKYLSHSFVESPDMMNIYNGTVITDATGFARVTMPDYFEALNRDFRYQLTVIGQFAQAIIGSKIMGNEFTIRTDKPGVEVSWQVTGIRKDAWANAHRIPVEEEKPEKERDHYLHPELFNQPPDKSIEWARHPEAQKKLAEQRLKAMSNAAQHTAQ